MDLRSLLTSTRYRLRTSISHVPSIYLPLANLRLRDEDGATIVSRSTDLVIEAFPRSGNTFAVTALQSSQPQRLRIAHHCHAPAQLIKAVRMRKPTLLIVRQPKAAVSSFILRHPRVSLIQGLKSWLHFHRALLPYTSGMAIATFDQVTSDMGAVVDAVNRRFGTSFRRFEHTLVNVEKIFCALEARDRKLSGNEKVNELGVARPSSDRKQRQAELESLWQAPNLQFDSEAAQKLYEKFSSTTYG
jgi:hypothetical protein